MNRFALWISVLALVAGGVGDSHAGVGKRVSTTYAFALLSIGPTSSPTQVMLALPTSYKSKKNFLKISTTYQAHCAGGGHQYSRVLVGSTPVNDDQFRLENADEDDGYEYVSKVYFLDPESQGGPAIDPAAMVTLELGDSIGDCIVYDLRIVAEALK